MRLVLTLCALVLGCAPSEAPIDARPGLDAGPPDVGPDANCASGACECMGDGDCTSPAACIDAVCIVGACQLRAYDSRCAPGEYCDRRVGCTMLPDGGMPDAPPFDANVDAFRIRPDQNLRAVASPCIVDRECGPVAGRPPVCIDADGELAPGTPAPPEGYCSARCDPFTLEPCGTDAVCVETDALTHTGWCMRRCAGGTDCEPGQACSLPSWGAATDFVCVP